jgi:hypothetical protein
VSDSLVDEVSALLVKARVALADPAAVGANFTVKGTLCPAAMVTGKVRPLRVNAELFMLSAVTLTLAPLALNDPDAVPLLPTATLPRLSVDGETANCPAVAAVIPLAVSGMFKPAPGLSILTLPLTRPAACGENFTVKVKLCPVLNSTGVAGPLTENPVPDTSNPLTDCLPEAVLVSTIDWLRLRPTGTCPKATLPGRAASSPLNTPPPCTETCIAEFVALLVSVIVPQTHLLAVGENVTFIPALCPAARTNGSVIPLTLKFEGLAWMPEIVTLVAPEFLNTRSCVCD